MAVENDLKELTRVTRNGFEEINRLLQTNTQSVITLTVKVEDLERRMEEHENTKAEKRISVLEDRSTFLMRLAWWMLTGVIAALLLASATMIWTRLENLERTKVSNTH